MSREKISRLFDANLNRLREGLRVLEDVARFILDDRNLTRALKRIRHDLNDILLDCSALDQFNGLRQRGIEADVGKFTVKSELKRDGVLGIYLANCQRVKESLRVLEEFLKLYDSKKAVSMKKMRYAVYGIEKRSIEKIISVCDN